MSQHKRQSHNNYPSSVTTFLGAMVVFGSIARTLSAALVTLSVTACSLDNSMPVTQPKPQGSPTTVQSNESEATLQKIPEYMERLQWVKKADATQDLEKALSSNDYAFWLIATRAPVFPGIDSVKYSDLIEKCGQKYLAGVGDVIFDIEHKALHQQAMRYAENYNRALIGYCQQKALD